MLLVFCFGINGGPEIAISNIWMFLIIISRRDVTGMMIAQGNYGFLHGHMRTAIVRLVNYKKSARYNSQIYNYIYMCVYVDICTCMKQVLC